MNLGEGWGVWLIVGVFAFNLTCIPIYFLVNHLQRTAGFERKRLETFLFLLEKRPSWSSTGKTELREAAAQLRKHLEEADRLGSLWGRKHTTLARLEMTRICDRFPEDGEAVLTKMERPR